MAINKQQALTLDTFHTINSNEGTKCHTWRRNGATKTWVTRPDDYRVPVKFGFNFGARNYANITPDNADRFYAPIECPVCVD